LRPVDNTPIPNPVRRLSKKRQQELADKLAAEQEAESLNASSIVDLADGDSSDQKPSEISDCSRGTDDKNSTDENVTHSLNPTSAIIENSNMSVDEKNSEINENAEHVIECSEESSAPIPSEEVLPEVSAPMLLFDEEVNYAILS
jgi:hypothetical protein